MTPEVSTAMSSRRYRYSGWLARSHCLLGCCSDRNQPMDMSLCIYAFM